jgi:hypothetical protein
LILGTSAFHHQVPPRKQARLTSEFCNLFRPGFPAVIPYPPAPSDPIELSLYGENLYPKSPQDFQAAIESYRARVTSIAENLVHLIAESLSPQPDLFANLFLEEEERKYPPYARLKVVRYPPVQEGEKGFGVGAHRDGGGKCSAFISVARLCANPHSYIQGLPYSHKTTAEDCKSKRGKENGSTCLPFLTLSSSTSVRFSRECQQEPTRRLLIEY